MWRLNNEWESEKVIAGTMSVATVVHLAEVKPITWAGEESGRFLLRAEDTGGRFSYYQVVVPAGEGSLRHLHEEMDETFHILDGEFEVIVGGETHHAPAGTIVYAPRNVVHAFQNVGSRPGTMLCITTPGGIERFFEELSDLLHADPPAEWSQMSDLAARYRIVAFKDEPVPAAAVSAAVSSE